MATSTTEKKHRRTLHAADVDGLEILQGASQTDVDAFLSVAQGFDYPADTIVVNHRNNSTEVHFLIEGSARVSVYAKTGRWVTYEMLGSGVMFGELSAIDNQPRSATVVTESRSLLAVISGEDFGKLITSTPFFVSKALQHLTRQSRTLMERLFEYSAMDVKGRVYAELLRLHRVDPKNLLISDKDMASRVGTTRENVTRIYSRLRNKNIISKTKSRIELISPEKLTDLLEESEFS